MQVWRFLHRIAGNGFIAARVDGTLVGYAIFVPSLKEVQRRALLSGEVFRWSWHAVRNGEFNFRSLIRIVQNKAMFVAGGQRFRTRGDSQLLNVAVEPSAQGRGIAQQLVREGLRSMREAGVKEVRLEVRPWNEAAVSVYRKTGWREAGRTRDREGEWLVMTASLLSP